MVHARICRTTAFLPWPFFEAPVQGFWPTIGHGPNELKPERPELIYKFTYPVGWIWTRLWTTNGSFLAWPGGHFTLVIILALFLLDSKSFDKTLARETLKKNHSFPVE